MPRKYTRTAPLIPSEERFWAKVNKTETCWLWTGARSRGYGSFPMDGLGGAHRWAYLHLVGPIPEGLELDHLCRVRHCVRPDHLEPVTHAENMRRGVWNNRLKTHCVHGHPFDEANTTWWKNKRSCRTCHRVLMRAKRDRAHQAILTREVGTVAESN